MTAFEVAAVAVAVVMILIGGWCLAGALLLCPDRECPKGDREDAGALTTVSVLCWIVAVLAAGLAVL